MIDLINHSEAQLLRLCAEMTKLQEHWDQPRAQLDQSLARRYWATADLIMALRPKTQDGMLFKAMVSLDALHPAQRKLDLVTGGGLSMWGMAVSVVKDVVAGRAAA